MSALLKNNLQFKIVKEDLFQSLVYINNIIERRQSIVVLSCVKIEAKGNVISLTATDLDISIVACINADVISDGIVVTSAQLLYDIVKKLSNNTEIIFKIKNGKLVIECGNAKFSLHIVDPDKFPIIENNELDYKFDLKVEVLIDLLSKTKFAMSTEESRYNLNGVYLHINDNVLCCVATDGHRLSLMQTEKFDNEVFDFGIIVPRKTVNEILRIISNDYTDKVISISLSKRKICFKYKDYVVTSKVIDGVFPDYKPIIPQVEGKHVSIESEVLLSVIDRVSVIVFDKVKVIKLDFTHNKLLISSASSDQGDAIEELDIDYIGEDITIGLNAKYLMEVLYCIKGRCKLIFRDGSTAIVIQDQDIERALYIIMPMRM
ncbi:DNA polymerase III subunit beta [Neoehrlichia mikurensis]|uniref:Beta sliding clamp n=1 Tax=Neoehrlichia mikurensis TaxID=89586 RepID=A0A9Q9F5H3_9RICK|nr:DNA polymerase III subunit beta [Neoehrlichia mikurensis]QXK91664.1 DNA polymerase III subunit beta [Neoehrlichia mikurensis]QXK92875.1 DNA polymerase III subunit beta [Neoehrlichia mikurensis]QXK93355.1 DNA polymerase III subunit beta [Neoehrlichia mikurensis]UTO55701.1 DNA polymerase III subunit beta [Neoehrlichia mikurensis]UTO56618.1 DNA polymerase III subunit beta [Neoehrlichia mikurensis]